MASLDTLKKSISEMSNEELMVVLQESRNRRRTVEPIKHKGKVKASTKKKAKESIDTALGKMTKEEKRALLRKLTGGLE
jgi:hypothetical protein